MDPKAACVVGSINYGQGNEDHAVYCRNCRRILDFAQHGKSPLDDAGPAGRTSPAPNNFFQPCWPTTCLPFWELPAPALADKEEPPRGHYFATADYRQTMPVDRANREPVKEFKVKQQLQEGFQHSPKRLMCAYPVLLFLTCRVPADLHPCIECYARLRGIERRR